MFKENMYAIGFGLILMAILAQQTLETALFRLRKLLGKSAVLVKDGRISLNPNCCWIDVLVFESTLKGIGCFTRA